MRTMKKVLALSLVLAMALSMMATAAFKDQEAINEDLTGDISLMVALNVFSEQGTGAGYFEPNRELTREEVAKLIYVLKNKGVDNGATSWTGMNIFKDIESGRWSEGYINYAASVGMMAGTGEGYFNPTAKMSAVEVAKLLLVLNGYKADVQGYLGTNWDVNIIRDAEAAGIFTNYDLPVRGSVTREWVARLMNNGINVTKVKYEDGQVQEMYNSDNEPQTFAKQDLGLVETTGVLIATPNAKLGKVANGGKANCELDTNGSYNTAEYTFKYDAPLNLLGQKVTVLSKGALNTTNKVYGVTTAKDNIVTTTTVDAVKWEDGEKFEDDFRLREDYKNVADFNGEVFFDANDGRTIVLVDYDNNEKYDAGFVSSVAYGKVSYVNPSSKTINVSNGALTGVDYEDINFIDTVVKGDVIKVTKTYDTGEEVVNVQKLDVVTGAVTKVTSNDVATIDGGEYKLSDSHIMEEDFALSVEKEAMDYFVDGKYVVYTDKIASAAGSQTNIAMLINAAEIDSGWKVENKVDILKNDGTRETYVFTNDGNVKWEDITNDVEGTDKLDEAVQYNVYEYVIKNGKISFNAIVADDAVAVEDDATGYEFKKSSGKLEKDESATYLTNSDSYFFVVDDADEQYSVVKASELAGNAGTFGGSILVYSKTGLPYVKYGVLVDDFTSDASTGYGILARSQEAVLNEENETVHKIVVTKLDGTEVTLIDDEAFATTSYGKFVQYTIDDSGYATIADMDPTDAGWDGNKPYGTWAAVTHVEGNSLMVIDAEGETAKYMTLADDAKIYYVDAYKSGENERIMVSEGDGVIPSADIGTSETEYANSVIYKTNDDGEITHIIVEIHGEEIWNNDVL